LIAPVRSGSALPDHVSVAIGGSSKGANLPVNPGRLLNREREIFGFRFRGPKATPGVASGPYLSGFEKETFPRVGKST